MKAAEKLAADRDVLQVDNGRLRSRAVSVERVVDYLSADHFNPGYAAAVRALIADNERLRWRHRDTLPEWNDLPDTLRTGLVRIGEQMVDARFGGDAMVAIWAEVRKELKP